MSVWDFDSLLAHKGHHVEVNTYADQTPQLSVWTAMKSFYLSITSFRRRKRGKND